MRAGTAARVLAGVAGVAMFAVAARYAVVRSLEIRPAVWVRWWVTAAVVHDVVVAPVAVAVGWAVVRFAPRWLKAPCSSAPSSSPSPGRPCAATGGWRRTPPTFPATTGRGSC